MPIFRILISNDDGIAAPGLAALVQSVCDIGGEAWVCAPDRERSAISHALTMRSPLRVRRVQLPGVSTTAWSVDGSPADCVKLALEELMPERPDVVLAGVNRGPNLGTDILYSGTVAAAAEGALAGIPSIAVSTVSYEPSDYSPAASVGATLAQLVAVRGLPAGVVLNVNVPDGVRLGRILVTRMGIQRYSNIFERRVDPRGEVYYWLCGSPEAAEPGNGLDTDAVASGAVSVSPIKFDMTDDAALRVLSRWDIRI
ncbi:MAG TPA: 5'/3'-nucleotidase SurE [Firmicutes bacterium]|jgi:5'-nucleotidase|nr:5'/3'-nucleotidase SurE [Bacillota bacterium]